VREGNVSRTGADIQHPHAWTDLGLSQQAFGRFRQDVGLPHQALPLMIGSAERIIRM